MAYEGWWIFRHCAIYSLIRLVLQEFTEEVSFSRITQVKSRTSHDFHQANRAPSEANTMHRCAFFACRWPILHNVCMYCIHPMNIMPHKAVFYEPTAVLVRMRIRKTFSTHCCTDKYHSKNLTQSNCCQLLDCELMHVLYYVCLNINNTSGL